MTRFYTEEQVVVAVGHVSVTRLRAWVRSGWVQPGSRDGAAAFTDLDVARIRLLCALNDDLAIDEDALPVVLSLIDQIHGLRRQLRTLGAAVEAQPEPVRQQIAEVFRKLSGA